MHRTCHLTQATSSLRVWVSQMGLLQGLSGALPPTLGRLPALTYVDLASNMLSGSLPAQLPASLQSIRLSGNFLTGTLPASYGAHAFYAAAHEHDFDCCSCKSPKHGNTRLMWTGMTKVTSVITSNTQSVYASALCAAQATWRR